MKKRDEREYAEEIPEATRKARLEEEAATLLSLPKDVRKMVMIKLKPIDMYALYSGVDNYAFKKWCDQHFWDYALRTLFPDTDPSEHMVHPRWRFFSYALAERWSRGRIIAFEKPHPDRLDVDWALLVEITLRDSGNTLRVSFDRSDLSFASFLIQLYIAQQPQVPLIERVGTFTGSIDYVVSKERVITILYKLFTLRYKFVAKPGDYERVFFLGCHLCGSSAVTGYSAEDPSKLLCGPVCNKK